jgi:hypothetical protein
MATLQRPLNAMGSAIALRMSFGAHGALSNAVRHPSGSRIGYRSGGLQAHRVRAGRGLIGVTPLLRATSCRQRNGSMRRLFVASNLWSANISARSAVSQ